MIYHISYWFYGFVCTALAVLFYHFYIAHLVGLMLMVCVAAWNGASFYVDVFSVRGFSTELSHT